MSWELNVPAFGRFVLSFGNDYVDYDAISCIGGYSMVVIVTFMSMVTFLISLVACVS
jgi:hypothetical protein